MNVILVWILRDVWSVHFSVHVSFNLH